ncbi:hypothetical protein F4803DRAFT_322588 [Xylaria telfairii]|nr:hypothetical protein F4803DRAFT_322588 [Xylaria telfairii]
MVGFIERLRKPKLPVVLGSPERDGVVNQRATTIPDITPPILRNFSYPTNIINSNTPFSTSASPSTWEQLGEICSFSPDTASRTFRDRTAGLEDPFFYTTDRTPYKQLIDPDEGRNVYDGGKRSTNLGPLTIEKRVEKRQRRSTLLGLSSPQVQATSRL